MSFATNVKRSVRADVYFDLGILFGNKYLTGEHLFPSLRGTVFHVCTPLCIISFCLYLMLNLIQVKVSTMCTLFFFFSFFFFF
jgi:hypothetical protein